MRTARQSGWSMVQNDELITLANDYGDYCEVILVDNNIRFWCDGGSLRLGDLPTSVIHLIALWFGIVIGEVDYTNKQGA